MKRKYNKPRLEVVFMNMGDALLGTSYHGNAGQAEDEGELNAKRGTAFDDDAF